MYTLPETPVPFNSPSPLPNIPQDSSQTTASVVLLPNIDSCLECTSLVASLRALTTLAKLRTALLTGAGPIHPVHGSLWSPATEAIAPKGFTLSLFWRAFHGSYFELSSILSLARSSCRLLFTARPTARPLASNPLRDAVRSRNPSKSTLAHDTVATAVLHKHHLIIRVGAGLIQFVYRSHLRLATEVTCNKNAFLVTC